MCFCCLIDFFLAQTCLTTKSPPKVLNRQWINHPQFRAAQSQLLLGVIGVYWNIKIRCLNDGHGGGLKGGKIIVYSAFKRVLLCKWQTKLNSSELLFEKSDTKEPFRLNWTQLLLMNDFPETPVFTLLAICLLIEGGHINKIMLLLFFPLLLLMPNLLGKKVCENPSSLAVRNNKLK